MVQITKLFPTHDATQFHAFARVISGTCTLLKMFYDKLCVCVCQYMQDNKCVYWERTTHWTTRKTHECVRWGGYGSTRLGKGRRQRVPLWLCCCVQVHN